MKRWLAVSIVGLTMLAALPAQARNVKYMLSIPTALESDAAKASLDASVKLYFGPQAFGKADQTVGRFDVHAKMPIEIKADIASCMAAFIDAVKTLQTNARDGGANAVVNIASYFKRGPVVSSATEFECHAGSYQTHVMLKGELVKLSAR